MIALPDQGYLFVLIAPQPTCDTIFGAAGRSGISNTAIIGTAPDRRQFVGIYFFRPPRTGVADSLLRSKASESTLNAAVPARNKGAEVYSISHTIRCGRTDVNVLWTSRKICWNSRKQDSIPQESRRLGSPRSWLSRSWSFISPEDIRSRRSTKVDLWRWSRPHPHRA
jgi:hypothetical protein